ncbi:MAG: oligoendopeptidase F [Chlamydiae bacterium]|nr:oligoendopeptidase F [Chlamydiota bacterium]
MNIMLKQTMPKKLKERTEIDPADCWDLTSLYSSPLKWEEDFAKWARPNDTPHWPEIEGFKGTLATGDEQVKKLLHTCFSIERFLSKLYTYAHLKHDEDIANDTNKQRYSRICSMCIEFKQETSWIEPELLSLQENILNRYLSSNILTEYWVYLKKIKRLKPHTLSEDKEFLIAMAYKAFEGSSKTFSAFDNADLKFPPAKNEKGEELELSHAKFLLFLRSRDRFLRESAFKNVHRSYLGFENTLCELINGQMQVHAFEAKARNYSSSLEAALFPNQIDTAVYHNLIQTVRSHLPSLHRYIKKRKQYLGYSTLHCYDLHVPLVEEVDFSYDYSTAENLVVESVSPLGKEYQSVLSNGLKKRGWVDRFENKRKRSGAYSSGCYDSFPYILMNFQGAFHDLMTLAHEAGHSMHSYFSWKHQPFQYANYSIFVAEVASTFNEELLFDYLLSQESDLKKKRFIINQKIDDIRATFFRQVMFAEFELQLHEWATKNVPLTPALLKETYKKLNADYFGEDLFLDEEIAIEWARIPHFYYNFYVYQYATGISAALALYDLIKTGDKKAKEQYLNFISSGSSKYPVELLKLAGVDLTTKNPIESTIRRFDRLVENFFENLT